MLSDRQLRQKVGYAIARVGNVIDEALNQRLHLADIADALTERIEASEQPEPAPAPEPLPEPLPAPPPVEGVPTPSAADRILFDTRESLQRAGTLMEALAIWGPGHYTGGTWAFSTDIDGRGTHALRKEWVGLGATCADRAALVTAYLPQPYPRRVYMQWKMHMGRTETGGGIGEIGHFQITNAACGNAGRKMLNVLRDVPDGGGTGRVDLLWHGPAPVHPGIAVSHTTLGNLWPNTGEPYDPDALVGRDVTHTVYLQAESEAGAGDGIVRLWVDDVLVLDHTDVLLRPEAFHRFQLPSTFRAPAIDQTEYFWDILAWEPAAEEA